LPRALNFTLSQLNPPRHEAFSKLRYTNRLYQFGELKSILNMMRMETCIQTLLIGLTAMRLGLINMKVRISVVYKGFINIKVHKSVVYKG